MKIHVNSILWSVTLLCAALVIGCTKEPISESSNGGDGTTIETLFTLTPEFAEQIDVRSVAGVDEGLVKDVWIIQLDAAGTTQLQEPQYFATVSADRKLSVMLQLKPCRVYFIANTHDSELYKGRSTSADVEAVTMAVSTESSLASVDGLPMSGLWTGTADQLVTAMNVSLVRSVSKVNFNLSASLPASDRFTLESVTVKQVPTILNYYRATDAATPYPTTPTVMNYIATTYSNTPLTSTPQKLWWYLPENARGTGTATKQQHKAVKFPTDQAAYCTYIEVEGMYFSATGVFKTIYKIYLGADNTSDYNLKRNTNYTVNTIIRGIDAADTRVSCTDLLIYLTDNKTDSPILISPKSMESASVMIWGPSVSIPGAQDVFNGKANTDALMALSNASDYHAAKYCRDQGAEWYLPSQKELQLMWVYQPVIPVADRPASGKFFWSSTEDSGYTSNSWLVDFQYGEASSFGKSDITFLVRCIRETSTPTQTWKYPKVEGGNTIVSRDAAGGIKADAMLTTAQKTFLNNQNTQPIYNEQNEYNRVSAKFQVASTDASTLSTWGNAYALCKSYSESGAAAGSWRLPTQRELQLMWMFKTKLTGCGTITTADTTFLSSTVYSINTDDIWVVHFVNGHQTFTSRNITSTYVARCVRDI